MLFKWSWRCPLGGNGEREGQAGNVQLWTRDELDGSRVSDIHAALYLFNSRMEEEEGLEKQVGLYASLFSSLRVSLRLDLCALTLGPVELLRNVVANVCCYWKEYNSCWNVHSFMKT